MIVYMDNFRGFTNTFFDIRTVNFLVGENSTGKTSLLSLINILFSQSFWIKQDFLSQETQFSHFDDIVSIYSKDRSYFGIGLITKDSDHRRKQDHFQAYYLIYRDMDGLPLLSELFFYNKHVEAHIVYNDNPTSNKIFYNLSRVVGSTSEDKIKKNIFPKWRRKVGKKSPNYKPLKSASDFPGSFKATRSPYLTIWELFISLRERKSEKIIFEPQLLPFYQQDIAWLAPIRTKPRRTYDEYKFEYTPEGEHTPYLIKRILNTKSQKLNFLKFVRRVGKESSLFEDISIRDFGDSSTSPFELDISLNEKVLGISNVGYGVSQALPVIVEIFARPKGSFFLIQQPEVHLHPKAQAALGSIIFELSNIEKKNFIVETHSDYLIDRFRINLKKHRKKLPINSQIVFFEQTKTGNKLHMLPIGEDGQFTIEPPKKYRSFFMKEQLELLGI